MKLDSVDLTIIKALLEDARTPFSQIAKELGIPVTTVHFRVKRMNKSGLIKGYTMYLNPFEPSTKRSILALLIKAVPSRTKEVSNFIQNSKFFQQNEKHISISSLWPCVGYYNIVLYVYANRAFDVSMIMHLLNNNTAIIEFKICNISKEQLFLKKIIFEQISKRVNKNR